jgi:M6 family metalloprotease-like protein
MRYINHLVSVMMFIIQPALQVQQSFAYLPSDIAQMPYQEVRKLQGYQTAMPSLGDVPMLVIPVSFTDYSCALLLLGCEDTKADIHRAFFGDEDDLRWHSVSSYYQASSYGQLTIEGTVTDWFTPTISAVELSMNSSLLQSRVILPALQWYRTTYQTDAQEFDVDDDGFLDAVYFVYSLDFNPEDEAFGENKDVFWAFVSYIGGQANFAEPTLFYYAWSSVQFMYEDGVYKRTDNGKVVWDEDNQPIFYPHRDEQGKLSVDAHVYIHEVGHLLGLVDYYSYDRQKGDWGASGALDMMDYNVGDHNSYSKAILGWAHPMVVTQPGTYSLAPFVTSGQFLLLPRDFQQTMMDDYLLLEFYTPTGVNEKDANEAYAGRYPRMFTDIGVKIYHVDARVGRYIFVDGRYQFNQYVTRITTTDNTQYRIMHSNTASRSQHPDMKLIHLLEAGGVNTFRHKGFATNATLFKTGDRFNHTLYPNFLFADGTFLPFVIVIGAMTESGVTIHVEEVG